MAFVKDPQAKLDYKIDWSDWLDADTISTSTWTVPTGITGSNMSKTATTTTIWLAGGTAGTTYSVTNHIITAVSREDERTIKIKVKEL